MSQKYEIVIERQAEKDLNKLPKNITSLIVSKIQLLEENPRPAQAKQLQTNYDDWRLRVGDYRVLYEIDDKKKIIRIFRAKHRKDIYRFLN